MPVETSRVALIEYTAPDGSPCVGSGLLFDDRYVLTADHVADGVGHRVMCAYGEFPVSAVLRSHDRDVDLAVMTLSEPAGELARLSFAQVNRTRIDRVSGCRAVGYPRGKKTGVKRSAAQVDGYVPTAEDTGPAAARGQRAAFLTLVGGRIPGAPLIPETELRDEPGSPWGGMSGAVVIAGDLVIGVVRSHNLAAGGQSLTVTPVTALNELGAGLRQRFWDVLCIGNPGNLSRLPEDAWVSVIAGALSPDVQDAYRPRLSAASELPVSWTLDELSALLRKAKTAGHRNPTVNVLTALCEALAAKPVFRELGGAGLTLGKLKSVYRREIGRWPAGNSADALLAEAASVGIAERHEGDARSLGALARFMVAVAAARSVPPGNWDLMARWIGSLGHQLADAQTYYGRRRDTTAWLFVDLGKEPARGAAPWPAEVAWTVWYRDGPIPGKPVVCETASAAGLKKALAAVLGQVPVRPLLVDLAVPCALMGEGIEHWPVLEVDDGYAEPLSARCWPRLRWSQRWLKPALYLDLVEHTRRGSWSGDAGQWVLNDPDQACFIGGRESRERTGPSHTDPLQILLWQGRGFIIWFPLGLPGQAVEEIARVVSGVPVVSRRDDLPEYLPSFPENRPVIIWDDPEGRAGFALPPPVMLESL